MTSQTRFRNKKKIVLAAVAVSLAVVVLLASLAYLHFFDASPFWEGGKWSDRQTQNFGWPQPVEFQGKLYMFYSAITKDTNTYTSDALQPSEYFLYDTFYRTFDGENFSDAVAVSAPTDEVSTQGGYFVYDGKLYALLTEKWIVNYTSYEWTSQVKLKWLDGDSWREVPSSFSQGETYYGLKALIGGDKAWLIWVQPESNVFSFKTFIGTAWSETRNATFPTSAPNKSSFTVVDGKLWATWENQTVRQGPPVFHTHEDIYVGSFDGENWSNVTWLNMPDDDSTNLRPFMTSYQGARFVFWESEYFLPSALAMRRVYDNDSLSQLTVVNPLESTAAATRALASTQANFTCSGTTGTNV
jgi:hypothetical protein